MSSVGMARRTRSTKDGRDRVRSSPQSCHSSTA